jgi:hypothetical protein
MAIAIAAIRDPFNLRSPGYIIAAVFIAVALFSWVSGRFVAAIAPLGDGPIGRRRSL